MGLLVVFYAAGLLLGCLSAIEWIVSRIARRILGGKTITVKVERFDELG